MVSIITKGAPAMYNASEFSVLRRVKDAMHANPREAVAADCLFWFNVETRTGAAPILIIFVLHSSFPARAFSTLKHCLTNFYITKKISS